MQILHHQRSAADPRRRGAALLLSFLVLMVIIALVYQLNRSTGIDQQVAHKDFLLTKMELAIESAMLEVAEQLREDAELKEGSEEAGQGDPGLGDPGLGDPGLGDPGFGDDGGGEPSNPDAVDSQMDEWAQIASTAFDDVQLRIYIEDEDRKYNVLNMLAADEEEAQEAYDRVVRIFDLCREGTLADIPGGDADEMARVLRDHLLDRQYSYLPRPAELLSDDPENTSRGMPLTLREIVVLEPFTEDHFRDYFDRDGNRVHSVTAFLTVYTSPVVGTGDGTPAVPTGGHAVNVNTAPLAVLASLVDPSDVSTRTWDMVLDYRNQPEEPEEEEEEDLEPLLDEFGEEVITKQIFDSIEELGEVPDWDGMEAEVRTRVESLLRVDSDVFSVYVTARFVTAAEVNQVLEFQSRYEQEVYERSGGHLARTVRAVFWRRPGDEGVEIVPLVRWEVLDTAPLPVLDYPDDDWRNTR